MARPRRTSIDAFIDTFLALSPDERPFAVVAIKAAERALGTRRAEPEETEAAEDLGQSAVQEALPGAKA